jgi:hypothetical protein
VELGTWQSASAFMGVFVVRGHPILRPETGHLIINGCYSREAKAFVEARDFDLGALVLHIPYTP